MILPRAGRSLCANAQSECVHVSGSDIKVEFTVPKEAEVGSSVELMCEWRLYGGNVLYSVKWYKDEHEFFRYVPDSNPRILMFTQPGVNVEVRCPYIYVRRPPTPALR